MRGILKSPLEKLSKYLQNYCGACLIYYKGLEMINTTIVET